MSFLSEFDQCSESQWLEALEKDLIKIKARPGIGKEIYDGLKLKPLYTAAELKGILTEDSTQVPHLRTGVAGTNPNKWNVAQYYKLQKGVDLKKRIKEDLDRHVGVFSFDIGEEEESFFSLLNELPTSKTGIRVDHPRFDAKFTERLIKTMEARSENAWCLSLNPLKHGPACFEAMETLLKSVKGKAHRRVVELGAELIHEQGASNIQEIASSLGSMVETLTAMQEKGFEASEIAKHLMIRVSVDTQYFQNIAKIRAMRALLAKALFEYGVNEQDSCLPILASVSRRSMTFYDRHNNILRSTIAAFSASVCSVNSIEIPPYDQVLRDSFKKKKVSDMDDMMSYRISRNIHALLQDESRLDHVIDPAGGSFYVENLTHEFMTRAWARFQDMQKNGGFFKDLENLKGEVLKVKAERLSRIEKRKDVITGINDFANADERLLKDWELQTLGTNFRAGDIFEQLRLKVEELNLKAKVCLAIVGPYAKLSARVNFCRNVFETLGFLVEEKEIKDATNMSKELPQDTSVVMICAQDEDYPAFLEGTLQNLQENDYSISYMAGRPRDFDVDQAKAQGLVDQVYMGQNTYELLKNMMVKMGVTL